MKVDGPGSSGNVSKSKKAAKKSGASGAGFSQRLRGDSGDPAPEPEASSSFSGGAALGSVDALLAVQAADSAESANPDGKGGNRQAVERGTDLLDRLDEVRVALLTGRLSQAMLLNLREALSRRSGNISDSGLKSVMQDIELRVEVELAKYDRR